MLDKHQLAAELARYGVTCGYRPNGALVIARDDWEQKLPAHVRALALAWNRTRGLSRAERRHPAMAPAAAPHAQLRHAQELRQRFHSGS